ncbi:MAG TPA: DUF3096 domain-containing protein [Chloroflexia bacterium]|nr:DUF3096 domain-containing protein [Chloroflexia bacterium]
MLVAGILILVVPAFLQIIVGVGLIVAGLWLALQNAQGSGNI